MHDTCLNAADEARLAMWRLSEEHHENGKRDELRRQWAEFYRILEANHRALARENARKALELESGGVV